MGATLVASDSSSPGCASALSSPAFQIHGYSRGLVVRGVERVLKFPALNDWHRRAVELSQTSIFEGFLKALNTSLQFNEEALQEIPETGPLLLVANHPLSGIEALALGQVLRRRRLDFKLVGLSSLASIPELNPFLIPVDPVGSDGATREANRTAFYSLLRSLKAGNAVLIFPSGWISTDPQGLQEQWSSSLGILIKKVKPAVLPVYFAGGPSLSFQILQAFSKVFATLLFPREILRQTNSVVKFHIGAPISSEKILKQASSPEEISKYVKELTYSLAGGIAQNPSR